MTQLFDTNHAIAYLNADPRLNVHLSRVEADDEFGMATPVLGELYYGAYASQRVAENLTKLEAFAARLILFEFDPAASKEFGKIRAEGRAKGKPISTADAQIAAIARLHGLMLLTNDRHFDDVDGLNMENWLV